MASEIKRNNKLGRTIQNSNYGQGYAWSFQGEGNPTIGSSLEIKQLNDVNAPIGSEYLDLVDASVYIKIDSTPDEDRGKYKIGCWKLSIATPNIEVMTKAEFNEIANTYAALGYTQKSSLSGLPILMTGLVGTGDKYLTPPDSPQPLTGGDYKGYQKIVEFVEIEANGSLVISNGEIVIGEDGNYFTSHAWIDASSSLNTNTLGFVFSIERGTDVFFSARPIGTRGFNGNNRTNVSGGGFLNNLQEGDKICAWVASEANADISIYDCNIGLNLRSKTYDYSVEQYICEQPLMNDEDFNSDTINVETYHKDKMINILSTNNYSVVLPKLSDVHFTDIFRFKNLKDSSLIGTFVPFSGEQIEGNSSFDFFGRGTLSIRKSIDNGLKWSIIEISNLFDHSNQGKTTEVSFESHTDAYLLTHNRGYKPIIQVYVYDVSGEYSEADVDVDHNTDMNSFIVNLEGINSGYIRYI
jgi:hypothetical protein